MKVNGRYRNAWLLCFVFLAVLWAAPGCQQQSTEEPTLSPLPSVTAQQEPTSSPEPSMTAGPEPTSSALPEPTRVTVDRVVEWMQQGVPLVFLDSRSEASWRASGTKIPGALRVPPDDVESHLPEIPRNRRIIVYCT